MKKKYKSLRNISQYFKTQKMLMLSLWIVTLFCSIIPLTIPIIEGLIFKNFSKFDLSNILWLCAMLGVANIIIQSMKFIQSTITERIRINVGFNIKHNIIDELTLIQYNHYQKEPTGAFVERATNDVDNVCDAIISILWNVCEILGNLAFFVYILFTNLWIGIYVFGTMFLIYITESLRLSIYRKNREKEKAQNDNVTATIEEIVRGMTDIKALGIYKQTINKMDTENKKWYDIVENIELRQSVFRRCSQVLRTLSIIGLIILCAYFLNMKLITAGTFFIIYLYQSRAMTFLFNIVWIKDKLIDGQISAKRIEEVMNDNKYRKEKFGSFVPLKLKGELTLEKVCFAYKQGHKILDDISFNVQPKSSVAIIGKSGEGKSTILLLISKLLQPLSGKILIDNYNINELSYETIKNTIALVPQEPYIFNMSIKENLRLAKPDATYDEIIDASKKAQLHDFVSEFPKGYETCVGENGMVLSGGERQRLAIARAFLKDSKIILFDESISELDHENQSLISKAIKIAKENKTVILVSHQNSILKSTRHVLILDNKKIKSFNNKNALKNDKRYQQIF